MNDLIAFLSARLVEFEDDFDGHFGRCAIWVDGGAETWCTCGGTEFLKADIAAKQQIIDEHGDDDGRCEVCADPPVYEATWHPYPCKTLRLLALPFASHPDYRE